MERGNARDLITLFLGKAESSKALERRRITAREGISRRDRSPSALRLLRLIMWSMGVKKNNKMPVKCPKRFSTSTKDQPRGRGCSFRGE